MSYYQSTPGPGYSEISPWSLKEVAKASNGLSLWLPKDVYSPGEEVVGKVKGNFSQRVTFRAVRIKLNGNVHIHWHTGSGKHRHDYSKTVLLFPEQLLTLQGLEKGGSGGKDGHLEASHQYEWDFHLTLPANLPGSLEFWEGTHIAYNLTAYVDIPLWPDYEVNLRMNVQPARDSVEIPANVREPLNVSEPVGVNSCCCCLSQGQAVMKVAARQRLLTFSSGNLLDLANLELMCGIDNMSKRTLQRAHFRLMGQVWMTNGNRSHTIDFHVFDQEIAPEILAGMSIPEQKVAVPQVQVERNIFFEPGNQNVIQQPTVNAGGILKISYFLTLHIQNGCGNDPESRTEVFIVPAYEKDIIVDAPPAFTPASAPLYPLSATGAHDLAPVYQAFATAPDITKY